MHAQCLSDGLGSCCVDGCADGGGLAGVLAGDLARIDGAGCLGGGQQSSWCAAFVSQPQGGLQQGVQLFRAAPEVVAAEEGKQGVGVLVIRVVQPCAGIISCRTIDLGGEPPGSIDAIVGSPQLACLSLDLGAPTQVQAIGLVRRILRPYRT